MAMRWKLSLDTPGQKFGYGQVPTDKRGTIKGNIVARPLRKGGDMTNAKYAEENGITKRQASKQRRGY